jgi:hypothetical protein
VRGERDGGVPELRLEDGRLERLRDSQRATLTNRNAALGDRLGCRRVDRYSSWVLKNARVRSQADRNASSCPSGTSNALIKTTGSPFMIVLS